MELVLFIISVSICSVIGCYLGKKLFKHHYKKCRFIPYQENK